MAIAYVAICLIVIFANITKVPDVLVEIVAGAFGLRAVAGLSLIHI